MRLLVANHHRALVGGVETYLAAVLPLLAREHEILFVHELPINHDGPVIPLPSGATAVEATSATGVLSKWRPDLAFLHAPHNLNFQRALIDRIPTVVFAHGYLGLCISGTKTWKRFPAHPCGKRFGWRCLLHFHAKSCGGSSPITMWRDYRRESAQLQILRTCDAVLTHAGPLYGEYLEQGILSERLFALPHFVEKAKNRSADVVEHAEARLIFVGRFDLLKGGHLLLEALPRIAERLGCPVVLKMVGSGPACGHWKAIAQRVSSEKIRVEFPGWVGRNEIDAFLAASDLIVAPSVWPEPFGQVGLEAGELGVPAVAFDVGGISTWLREGENGHLARANPPSAEALADAVVKSLGNREHYAKLRAGALKVAGEFSVEQHIRALQKVFETVLARRRK
jgi:glycosyltransferase involved in cell wall biosynthesis